LTNALNSGEIVSAFTGTGTSTRTRTYTIKYDEKDNFATWEEANAYGKSRTDMTFIYGGTETTTDGIISGDLGFDTWYKFMKNNYGNKEFNALDLATQEQARTDYLAHMNSSWEGNLNNQSVLLNIDEAIAAMQGGAILEEDSANALGSLMAGALDMTFDTKADPEAKR
jgi:hypothetical protein